MSEPDSQPLNAWGRRGVPLAWLATVLLVLPALQAGFTLDDFLQRLVLEGKAPELGLGPATLYDFTGRSVQIRDWVGRGYVPWHTDPALSLRFFRPLGSLSIALDAALFGRAAFPSHLMGAALFAATSALAFAFFRRILSPNRAGLAAFLFAVAGGHYLNLTWVAGRHVLVGGFFGALAVLAHVANAEGRAPRWLPRWVAFGALFSSMLASETSLAVASMLASYELIVNGGTLRRRLLGAAPWLVAGVVYVALYASAGYGVKHSALYISPLTAPWDFTVAAVTRLPMLLGELAFSVPAFAWGLAEPARPGFALLGVATSSSVVWLAFRGCSSDAERRRVAWCAVATLLGVLPMVGGVPDGRMLLLPFLTSMPLVATAIDGAWAPPAQAPRRLLRLAAGVLVFMNVGVAALLRVAVTEAMVGLARKQRALAETADLSRCTAGSPIFVLTGADPSLCLSGGTSLRYYRPELSARHPRYSVLSMVPQDQRLERTGEYGITLQVEGEPRRATMFEALFRDGPLAVGQRIAVEHLEAQVLATERGFFMRVAFGLPRNACLLALSHQKLVGQPLPPIGTSLEFPHELGPMGF